MSDHEYRVYKYLFPDGMVYIGMTKRTLETRRDMGYQHNEKLKAAMRKYGWSGFQHDILIDGLTREEAEQKEKELIKEFDSTDPNKGYNVSIGGRETFAGLRHTEEFRKMMSEKYKRKVFSEETLAKMKEAHKKERTPVSCLDDVNDIVKEFESLHEAAKWVGGHPTNIIRACRGKRKYKGFYWESIAKVR